MAKQERMMFCTRPVTDVREKNRLIGERCKGILKDMEVWSESRKKSVMMPRFLAWRMGVH